MCIRDRVQQDDPIAVERAAFLQRDLQGRGFADFLLREAEDHVFVENVEVAVRALADEAAVERLGHEQEVPFHGARTVDQVLPELAGKAPVSYTHLDVYKRQGPGWPGAPG